VELYNKIRITRCHCVVINNPEKNAVFWDVVPCRSCVNRRFEGMYILHLEGRKIRERGSSLQPPAHACSSLADFSNLKMEAIGSSESSVHTRSTRCHIPEDGIFHSHRRENLKSYIKNPVSYPGGLAFDSGSEAIIIIFLVVNNEMSYVQAVLCGR
jgi:hypothetical protein